MSYLREMDLGATHSVSVPFQKAFGFLPNLFRAQTLLPRILEAVGGLTGAVRQERALSSIRKESIMLCVAAAYQNAYCVALRRETLHALGMRYDQLDQIVRDHHQAGLSRPDTVLLSFVLKLATRGYWLSGQDVGALQEGGFDDESILEAVVVTALTHFLCTLSAGLGPSPDFGVPPITGAATRLPRFQEEGSFIGGTSGPYLATVDRGPEAFPPMLLERFHFIPKLFRAQTLRWILSKLKPTLFLGYCSPKTLSPTCRRNVSCWSALL